MFWVWLIGLPIAFTAIAFALTRHGIKPSNGEMAWVALVAALWPLWIVGLVLVAFSLLYGVCRLFDALDFE